MSARQAIAESSSKHDPTPLRFILEMKNRSNPMWTESEAELVQCYWYFIVKTSLYKIVNKF